MISSTIPAELADRLHDERLYDHQDLRIYIPQAREYITDKLLDGQKSYGWTAFQAFDCLLDAATKQGVTNQTYIDICSLLTKLATGDADEAKRGAEKMIGKFVREHLEAEVQERAEEIAEGEAE